MNERIKLLAEQAGWDNHHSKFDTRIEKFAELIVRECIDKVQRDDGATDVEELLLKHFGVRE